jgi:hypothetical protein
MRLSRDVAFWACLVAGLFSLVAGAILFVASRDLFDPDVFGARAEQSLADPGVSAYAAELVTRAVIGSRPDLIAIRPVVRAAASGVVATHAFQALVGQAARRAHRAVFSEGARRILLSLPDLNVLLRSTLEQASPELAAKVPKQVETVVASLGQGRTGEVVVRLWKLGQRIRRLWQGLFPAGFLLLVSSIWLVRNRRRGMVRVGLGLLVAGLILLCIVPAGSLAAGWIGDPLQRGLARGIWRAYFGELSDWGLFYAGLGILVASGAASLLENLDPGDRLRRISRLLVAPPVGPSARLVWSTGLLLAGIFVVVRPRECLTAVAVLAGISAAFLGVRELFRLFLEHLAPHPPETEADSGAAWGSAAAIVAGIVAILAVSWALWRTPVGKPAPVAARPCNGSLDLCGRRVDEVVFAAAHNAMSNQEVPDWMFPHHEAGIPRQLRDGVRALLFDVHYGFPGASRIKTDLGGEPLGERVRQVIGPEGYQAAMRIRDRLVGVKEGRRGIYLCHGVCELGAYELEPALRDIRDFLVASPDEVLILVIEDTVQPRDLAQAFERSRLADFVYRGPSGPPWPVLKELIHSGQRVLVFIESGRPGVSWLRPAFESIRETPYTFHSPKEFSCRANRGGDAGSLFLMNNWIESTPTPKPSNAALVNAFEPLLSRARQCAGERGHLPNIIAVDFYRTGDLLKVVNELNGSGSSSPAAAP